MQKCIMLRLAITSLLFLFITVSMFDVLVASDIKIHEPREYQIINDLVLENRVKQRQPLQEHNLIDEYPNEVYRTITSLSTTELDSFIIETMDTYHIPGLAACIVKEGQLIWTNSYGYANIEDSIKVADTTVFMLASVSKTITGVALMQLFEQGLFGLDDDINDYLPFEVHSHWYPDSVITFKMLMTHTSGIKDNWTVLNPLTFWGGDSPIPLDTFLVNYLTPGGDYYYSSNFNNQIPGTNWDYCNVAVALAGYLVEAITGIPFDQYCEDSIFIPLNMYETSWFLADLDTNNIAMPYYWSSGTYYRYGHSSHPMYPAGWLRSSTLQLARFLTAFMQEGQIDTIRILDSTTVELMTTVYCTAQREGINFGQGLIWYIEYRGERWLWKHGGDWYGVTTVVSYYPEENSGVVVLTNGHYTQASACKYLIEVALYEYAANLLTITDYDWEDSGGDGHADPGDTLNLTVSILNSYKDASTVDVNLSSNDPFITMIDSISNYGEILSDSIKDNSGDPFILWIDDDADLHLCTLKVSIMADSLSFSHPISFVIGGIPPILVVDDDGGDTYETYYIQALERKGYLCDVREGEDNVPGSFMSDFQALIWLTGDNSHPVDSLNIIELADFLNSGGNLFITGQDVEGCADTIFYHNYLHAKLVEDSTFAQYVAGVAGDTIGDGLIFPIIGGVGAGNQVTPSIISPIGGADSIFNHYLGGCCGVKYEDTYKVVYLSFGFEGIAYSQSADNVMKRIINWFGVSAGVEEEKPEEKIFFISQPYPNPFMDRTQIEYNLPVISDVNIAVYNVLGARVITLLNNRQNPGIYTISWDGNDERGNKLPNGFYFLQIEAGEYKGTRKLLLIR